MPKLSSAAGLNLPKATPADVQRFKGVANIQNPDAFAAVLDRFVAEKVASATQAVASAADLAATLAQKASALRAKSSWRPSATDIQRGRQLMLEVFDRADNLPLPEFARLAHKSRQQIYKDLSVQPPRLLALSVGPRRQRLPDWQLDPVRLQLTREVLKAAEGIDAWTVYHALSSPLDALRGRSPIDAVSQSNVDGVVKAVCGALGVH